MRFTILFPYLLVWFRLTLAPCFWLGYWFGAEGWIYVVLLLAGIISDIFDGVLARRWKTSEPRLRRLDGNVDTVFYSCAGLVAVLLQSTWLQPWKIPVMVMFLFMIIHNVIAFFRYGRQQPSYHMWSGKLWSIVLVIALIGLYLNHPSSWVMTCMISLAIYNSIEGIIASIISPKPLTDVPTIFHVIAIVRAER